MITKLYNGVEMPRLGLGTFLVQDGSTAYDTTLHALKIGYRHLDTAQMYQNEASIGQAIVDSKVPRKDIFITTKQRGHSTIEKMRKQFEDSLVKLQTDYVDLYLIHWPNHDKEINQQTWSLFEELYREKKVRAIGVSNFQRHHIEDLMETATIKPMINQVELHPGLSQIPLQTWLNQHGIQIESYGPFMKGGIFEGIWLEGLSKIALNHHVTVPQIVIAWGLSRNVVMIPKSVTPERIEENYRAQDIKLTNDEIEMINQLNRGKRVYTDPDNSPWGPFNE